MIIGLHNTACIVFAASIGFDRQPVADRTPLPRALSVNPRDLHATKRINNEHEISLSFPWVESVRHAVVGKVVVFIGKLKYLQIWLEFES